MGIAHLGRYKILKHLATGGMAEVYLATATGIEGFSRHVVIKCIHKQHATNETFIQMFLAEARLAASLHHHNIVQVHDIGQEEGEYFYAMEYVHGEDLRTLLGRISGRKELVPLEHIVAIIMAAAAGLHYAHEARGPDRRPLGLVHRDVSPSNIIVDYDGNVKVVDFGIAKAALRTEETKSGVLKGKIAYMSPEQCRGKPIDRRSDIYALGIVLHEMLTARRLFKGESDFMTMSAIVAGQVPPPSERRPDLPPELDAIALKALARDPEDRYQTALELRKALDQFATTAGLRISSTALGEYMTATFGHRPEPWLVDAPSAPGDYTIDFDGSASGLANVSMSAIESFVNHASEPRSSPFMRARKKTPTPRRTEGAAGDAPDPAGTPMAWESASVNEPRSRRLWVVAGVAIPLILVGVLAGPRMFGSSETKPTMGAAQPEVVDEPVHEPVRAEPTPAPPTPTIPATQATPNDGSAAPPHAAAGPEPTAPPNPAPTASPTTTKPLGKPSTTPKPGRRPAPPTPAAPSNASWDPDSLLPD